MTSEPDIKRWTAKRKAQVVVDILKGKTTVAGTPSRFRFPRPAANTFSSRL